MGDSGRAAQITKDAYPDRIGEMVLIQSKTLKTDDPEYRAVVADVTQRLEDTKGVTEITGPYGKGEQRSRDLGRRAFHARQLRDQGRRRRTTRP